MLNGTYKGLDHANGGQKSDKFGMLVASILAMPSFASGQLDCLVRLFG